MFGFKTAFGLYEHGSMPPADDERAKDWRLFFAEPSDEWLENFPKNFQRGGRTTYVGKFVAARDIVVCAPYPDRISHHRIATARTDLAEQWQNEIVQARAEDQQIFQPKTDAGVPVTDAGFFMIHPAGGAIDLHGDSHGYSQHNTPREPSTRPRTVAALRALLGAEIAVTQIVS